MDLDVDPSLIRDRAADIYQNGEDWHEHLRMLRGDPTPAFAGGPVGEHLRQFHTKVHGPATDVLAELAEAFHDVGETLAATADSYERVEQGNIAELGTVYAAIARLAGPA